MEKVRSNNSGHMPANLGGSIAGGHRAGCLRLYRSRPRPSVAVLCASDAALLFQYKRGAPTLGYLPSSQLSYFHFAAL